MNEDLALPLPPFGPGVVLYEPGDSKSEVLAGFAQDVARRGWRVSGFVIETLFEGDKRVGLNLRDLRTGASRPLARQGQDGLAVGNWALDPETVAWGTGLLHQAVDERCDLIVTDKWGPLEGQGQGYATALHRVLLSGIPSLTAVRSEFLAAWDRFAGVQPELLRPKSAELWQWWGVERLAHELLHPIEPIPVDSVIQGLNWTLVAAGGRAGLAQTPARGSPGCRQIIDSADMPRQSLADLANRALTDNGLERAVGWAAINAWHNRSSPSDENVNGFRLFQDMPRDTVVIGRFPKLATRLPGCKVIERDPREGEFGELAAERLLPAAKGVVITASTLVNGSFPRLVRLAQGARIAVVGPGTPLSTDLAAYGIAIASGTIVEGKTIDAVTDDIQTGTFPRSGKVTRVFVRRRVPD